MGESYIEVAAEIFKAPKRKGMPNAHSFSLKPLKKSQPKSYSIQKAQVLNLRVKRLQVNS